MVDELAAFFALSAVVIVTPGPDTALTIRNALLGGRRSGVLTAFAVATGQVTWTVAASAGVAAVLAASAPAFQAAKLLGAAYLVFLGTQALLAAATGGRGTSFALDRGSRPRLRPAVAYRQGVVSNLANPKMAVFFTSLLPQFATRGDPSFTSLLALGFAFATMTLVWLSGYAIAAAKAGDLLGRTGIRRALDALLGAVLVALGVRLATEKR